MEQYSSLHIPFIFNGLAAQKCDYTQKIWGFYTTRVTKTLAPRARLAYDGVVKLFDRKTVPFVSYTGERQVRLTETLGVARRTAH